VPAGDIRKRRVDWKAWRSYWGLETNNPRIITHQHKPKIYSRLFKHRKIPTSFFNRHSQRTNFRAHTNWEQTENKLTQLNTDLQIAIEKVISENEQINHVLKGKDEKIILLKTSKIS